MRPDKHKKRKNAAYKKKHGIPSGKGERVEKNGSTSSHRSGEKSSTSAVSVTAKESKAVSETDSRHEGESSDHESQNFSRRKIQSNWDRYDETIIRDEDCEDVSESDDGSSALSNVPNGAYVQSLPDKAANGCPPSRVKSKKEWEHLKVDESIKASCSTVNGLDGMKAQKAEPCSDTVEDLEDWLDSILD